MTSARDRKVEAAAIVNIRRDELPALEDDTLVGAYRTDLRLHQDRSATTEVTYTFHLGAFRGYLADKHPDLALPDVQSVHVRAFLHAEAARGIAPTTRASALFALRSFYEYLRSEDLFPLNPTLGLKVPGARKLRTEVYSDAEADLILSWAVEQPGLRGRVGHAVLATLRYTGLRRNEVSIVRLDGVDLEARRLSVVGKGDKPRIVPVAPPLVPILDDYLKTIRPELPSSAFFFANPSAQRDGRYRGRLGPPTVAKIVERAGNGAGVAGRHFPHRWRHSYATSLLRRGVDIHVVQRLLGHSNIATTIRYLHLSDADLTEAVERAFPAE
jgi:site-specific recombinase XerD